MHQAQQEKPPRKDSEEHLLAFPIVSALCYLHDTGLYNDLVTDGVSIHKDAVSTYGPEKMDAGVLGFLFAVGKLEKTADGIYFISDNSSLTPEYLEQALVMREIVKAFCIDWTNILTAEVQAFPSGLKAALSTPLLRYIDQQLELGNTISQELMSIGAKIGVSDDGIKLNTLGEYLRTSPIFGSFLALSNSYQNLLNFLFEARQDPTTQDFRGKNSRNPEENAKASNKLIENLVQRLRNFLNDRGFKTILDLGSGGGFFAQALETNVILLDYSELANKEARKTFANSDIKPKEIITGSIMSRADLEKARIHQPDAVTINYILHDILGQAPTYEEGVKLVKTFLTTYKDVFENTPLLITESWYVNWNDLKKGNKPFITLFSFLHEISPQRLMSREELFKILTELGFEVESTTIPHGYMEIDSEERVINETWVVQYTGE